MWWRETEISFGFRCQLSDLTQEKLCSPVYSVAFIEMSTTNPTNRALNDVIQVFTNNMDFSEKETIWLCVFLSAETGSYVCEFCGKHYKYFNPYQEHVALHTPMGEPLSRCWNRWWEIKEVLFDWTLFVQEVFVLNCAAFNLSYCRLLWYEGITGTGMW